MRHAVSVHGVFDFYCSTPHLSYCLVSLLLRIKIPTVTYVGELVQLVGRSPEVDVNDFAAGHEISASKWEVTTYGN